MKTVTKRHWVLISLHCFLVGSLVDSSSSSSRLLSVTSKVGNRAVLPCSWKQRLQLTPSACHVQWATPADTVFEMNGNDKWEAEEFEGRVEVPEEKLGSGNCSLIINDVQIGDSGRYESFMVVDGMMAMKTKVFIQGVKLSVFDHKSFQSRGPGEDLVLELYTRHSMRVVFQDRNSSEWSVLWKREDEDSERLQRHSVNEQLRMRKLKSSDEGIYKVLDERGLAVSTVQLSVEENSTALKRHQLLEKQALTDDAVRSSCSALLFSVLVTSFQIIHLL
ncbi:uncharacterized protein LOC116400800 [Anarrhichthys ocellatus]|uniref:uncharacterized protein LOC116400800 n=1 Tax=Anarrhichthys ocellatus TaxID=433405 RepID=UPI0012ED8DB8|nr:uncharacterized protein LOC116400800 [Anarrhichthys ocellatus]